MVLQGERPASQQLMDEVKQLKVVKSEYKIVNFVI
jgi:hypothetical protein